MPRQAIWVVPVFTPADLAGGVEPMPPNDVTGSNWNWPALWLLALSSTVLAAGLVTTARAAAERWRTEEAPPPPTPAERQPIALAELDALLSGGRDTPETLQLYTRSSDTVRRYLEAVAGPWPPSLTSTELMRRLARSSDRPNADHLASRMHSAETVKFGQVRPDAAESHAYLQALRSWVASSMPTGSVAEDS